MAQKQKDNSEFEALKETLESGGRPDRLYFLYGEERYLLEHYLGKLRDTLAGGDFSEFNWRKFTGAGYSFEDVAAACEALPVFSERTVIEVHDLDILKAGADLREKLAALTADLPEEACLIFVSPAARLDGDEMKKLKTALGKSARVVAFEIQEKSKLVKWVRKHFAESGRNIDPATAEYLLFVTGGAMLTLKNEIDKLTYYVEGQDVTRADIDKLVTPVLDAQHYTMTDHIAAGRFDSAAAVLADLLSMSEPPHKLMFSISLKLRQLYLARLLLDNGQDLKQLMKTAGISFEFQARNLMSAARSVTPERCRSFVLFAAGAAYRMNSGGDAQEVLKELLIRLAECSGRRPHA